MIDALAGMTPYGREDWEAAGEIEDRLTAEKLPLDGHRLRLQVTDGDELLIFIDSNPKAVLSLDFRQRENIIEVSAFDAEGHNVSSFVIAPLGLGF